MSFKKISIVTFGCKMNQAESQAIGEKFLELGFDVSYDKDLPEIPYRLAYEPPTSYLAKKKGIKDEFEIIEVRRPSTLLLINKLRKAVDAWRSSGYEGESSEVTRRLFNYWFDEDHLVKGKIFRYYFAQREAVETIIYLLEVAKTKDLLPLINEFGEDL